MDFGHIDELQERADQSTITASSPLSELPGTPEFEDEGTPGGGSTVDDDDKAATGDDKVNGQSLNQDFRCEYCRKAYKNEKSLKGHLREKRNKCAKRRADAQGGATMYACTRCHAQMARKNSVERHIKESCWKICDECVEAGNPTCDANHSEGDCSHCMELGLACTQYTAPIPDSIAQPLTAARTTATPTVKREHGKRKASASPDGSPEFGHVVKRPTATIKKDTIERPYMYRPQPSGNNATHDVRMGGKQNLSTAGSNTQYQQPSYGRSTTVAPHGVANMPQPGQPPQQPRGHYDGPGRALSSTAQFAQMQHLQQGRGIAPQIAYAGPNAYGMQPFDQAGPDYTPNASTRALDEALRLQHQKLLYNMACATSSKTSYLAPPPLQDPQLARNPTPVTNLRRTNFNDIHPPESRLNRFRPAQSNFKIHEDAPDTPAQRLRPRDFIASAPGSRMPSRQSSVEPVEDPRAQSRMPAFEQLQGMSRMPRTIAKKPVARELTEPLAYHPAESPIVDENSPVLRFRIHSNTYDPNGTPIFSILTLRGSDRFGPRLDAYCQQRDKQYGKDWVFVYHYALGHKGGGEREKYIKITYDMTPEEVHDPEQSNIKLRDMDTITVMKAKQYAAMDANKKNGVETPLSPVGSQVSEDEVEITAGETRIFQNAGTINEWQQLCENKLGEMQLQMAELNNIIRQQRQKLAKQEVTLADLETRNMNMAMASLRAQAGVRTQATGRAQAPGRVQPTVQPSANQGPVSFAGLSESQIRAMVAAGYEAKLAREAAARMSTQQKVAGQEQLYQQQSIKQQQQQVLQQRMMAQQQQQHMDRQQLAQFRFPNNGAQDRRPTYASGPQEPFPDFVDPDGLPLFRGQDNPPPEFRSPRYADFAPAASMFQQGIPGAQPQGSFWAGLPSQNNVPLKMRNNAPVSEAGSKIEVAKADGEDADSVMGDE